jgi:hypothetical protein
VLTLRPSLVLLLWCTAAIGGCSTTITPTAVQDAQLAARVKTALVNDPQIGTHPIEVRTTGGVVRLVGRLDSQAQADRAIALARGVPGVSDVLSDLRIIAVTPPPPGPTTEDPRGRFERLPWVEGDEQDDTGPRLLAIGVAVSRTFPATDLLSAALKAGPLVRLGRGRGWGPAIGFGWVGADWRQGAPRDELVGQIRLKPVMGGIAYGFAGRRATLSLALVGGISFNSLSLPDALPRGPLPLDVSNSFAIRPGVTVWIEASRRIAVSIGGSYLMTRPNVRVRQEDGRVTGFVLRADPVLVSTGIVYKLF